MTSSALKEKARDVYGSRYNKIQTLRAAFVDAFKACGFEHVAAESLVPGNDDSILFSNATITPIKNRILDGVPLSKGWVIDQPCLRLQNLKDCLKSDFDPEFMNFFHMVGVFVPRVDEEFSRQLLDTLNKCGLNRDKISLRGCARDADLIEALSKGWGGIKVDICDHAEGYFDWSYGMNGYRGRGVHLMIEQPDGKTSSVGQLVEMSGPEGVVGYEFGFGCETFLARLNAEISIHNSGLGRDCFPAPKNNLERQYIDCAVSCAVMNIAGVKLSKNGRGAAYRRALRTMVQLERVYECPPATDTKVNNLISVVSRSIGVEASKDSFLSDLDSLRNASIDKEEKYKRYVCERLQECLEGKRSFDGARAKITKYSKKIGLSDALSQKIVRQCGFDKGFSSSDRSLRNDR